MEVKGKAVFLTGGAQGIGRALCTALLNKGAKIFFCDINPVTGKTTEAELQKQYGADNVSFAQCDVTEADQLTGVFKKAVDTFGAVDICVNIAGILDERIWEKEIAVNMIGMIRGSQLALEHMRLDKGGRGGVIINMSSVAGLRASPNMPVYAATKHAVVGFTQSWATNPRMKEMGVRWGTLCPGPVDTDLLKLEEGQIIGAQDRLKTIKNKKIKPETVAEAFMTLLEDEDSNGALMVIWPDVYGVKYKKRQLVDSDGVSNPVMVDASLV